jgi:hypothetical protein
MLDSGRPVGWMTGLAGGCVTWVDLDLAPKARLCPAKYRSLFVRKFRQKYLRLRTRLYHELCLSLHLNLNLNLYLYLNSSTLC